MKFIAFFFILTAYSHGFGQAQEKRMFVFGHSLIDHRPPLNPTPSDETTVPHWVFLLAEAAGHQFSAGGQYGFLPQHASLPPFSQWGYDVVPGVWESDLQSFTEANINTLMITAGNFIQYQPPSAPYEDPNNIYGATPVSATQDIVDWIQGNTTSATIYIYENWPDMAGVLGGQSFPVSPIELEAYYEVCKGPFHDWWIEYQDILLQTKPEANVRMIPVGPIIAEVYEQFLRGLPSTELYEDDAPHGRPNIYFLSALSSYMAIFQEKAPETFVVPDIISNSIKDNYQAIVDYIWNYLLAFNDTKGISRVFNNLPSPSDETIFENAQIFPNPASDVIQVVTDAQQGNLTIMDADGRKVIDRTVDLFQKIDISFLNKGSYFGEISSGKSSKTLRFRFVKI